MDTLDCHYHCCYVWLDVWFECVQVCFVYTGMTFEVKIEADSNDITEHPHDDKQRPYLCTVCDKRFTTKGNLKQHKQIHNVDRLYYECVQCEKRFTAQVSLKQHMNLHSRKYKCTECRKCFCKKCDLMTHRRIHSGEKLFECTVCRKRFTHLSNLTVHSRIHSGDKPYKCPECDKVFTQSGGLTAHMRVHTGDKPYKCSVCDKSFRDFSTLQRHKRQVHECHYCGMMYERSQTLKLHVYTHTGAKPYSCRHCSDCFTHLSELQGHLLMSHNEDA